MSCARKSQSGKSPVEIYGANFLQRGRNFYREREFPARCRRGFGLPNRIQIFSSERFAPVSRRYLYLDLPRLKGPRLKLAAL